MRQILRMDIPARRSRCGECKRRFEEGDLVRSALVGDEERIDRCEKCWAEPEEYVSLWWSVMPAAKDLERREMEAEGRERAIELLERYLREERFAHAQVLAMYLARRGVLLKARGAKPEEIYEVPETGQTFAVPRGEAIDVREEILAELQ